MSITAGLRSVQVFNKATQGSLYPTAIYFEVTNEGSNDVTFYPNDFPDQGHPTKGVPERGIPIKAGTTRIIPMMLYNFTATAAVTVVAYSA